MLVFPIVNLTHVPSNFYGVAFGWLDRLISRNIFKLLFPQARLKKFNDYFISRGFKTFVGVINSTEDFHYFQAAGIVNICTDKVKEAAHFAITEKISL